MSKITRQWPMLSEEKRKKFIDEIITFFKQKRDEDIGVIAGEEVLDFFLENISEEIYNKGVGDSKELLKKRFADLEFDLDLLLKK